MGMRGLLDALFPPRNSERLVARATEDDVDPLITPTVLAFEKEQVVGLLSLHHPLVRALITEVRLHDSEKACTLLGRVLATYLGDSVTEQDTFEMGNFGLVPIPLSKKQHEKRGYNQVERVTACAITFLGLQGAPSAGVLVRTQDTLPQARLRTHEREENVRGAFRAGSIDPAHTYILIDDFVTTGATLAEAARTLRTAGASRVICISLSY